MEIETIADVANKLSRADTWSDFTPEAKANRSNIPGNMPFGYVVHLVKIGRVDLSGLINLEMCDDISSTIYTFTQSNEFINTLQLNAMYRNKNQCYLKYIGNISFDDFKELPSFSNLFP